MNLGTYNISKTLDQPTQSKYEFFVCFMSNKLQLELQLRFQIPETDYLESRDSTLYINTYRYFLGNIINLIYKRFIILL